MVSDGYNDASFRFGARAITVSYVDDRSAHTWSVGLINYSAPVRKKCEQFFAAHPKVVRYFLRTHAVGQ